MGKTVQPRYWGWLLLAAQAIYLVFELSFNSRLVDSIMVSDALYFDRLSFIGRCISGVGFTLVCYAFIHYRAERPWWKTASILLLAAALAFPAMFFGQEKLINHFVDQSSAEQRMHAQYLMLLKKGLANNAVVLKGIDYEKEDLERPAIKTFISNLGFMVFFTPDYIQAVIQNSDQILEHISRQKANKEVDQSYPEYLNVRKKVEQHMAQYNDANQAYINKLNKVPKQAEDIWRDIFVSLQKQWKDIQKQGNRDAIEDSLDALIDGLDQYKLGKQSCQQRQLGHDLCLQKVDEVYQQKMQDNFGRSVEPRYWCKRIIGKMVSVMQGSSYIKKMQPDSFECNNLSRDFLRQKMLKLKGKEGAYFASWDAFVGSKAVADSVREKLAPKGIHVPAHYRIHGHDSFIKGVSSELTRQLREGFMKQAKQDMGEAVAPLLSRRAFLELPLIQRPLKKALHLDANHAPVPLNLSEVQFRDQILMPVITRHLEKERRRLLASSAQFADGADKEEEGKQYVRSILVPPVAMGFSMFFALLNLSGVVAGLCLLAGGQRRWILTARATFLLAVIVLPLIFSGEIAQTKTFQSIVQETEKATGPVLGGFIVWIGNLQPVVYPVGHVLATGLHLFVPPETS